MKKFISIIFTITLLFSCLGLTVFAANSSVTISEDYQKLYVDGESYSRFNASLFEIGYIDSDRKVALSDAQKETISNIELYTNEHETIVETNIYFKDGAYLSITFLRDDYLDTYNEIVNNQSQEYVIDFGWPQGNTVIANKTDLFGNTVTFSSDDLEWCDYFYVTITSDDDSLNALKGSLITLDDEFYYADFEEAGITNGYGFYPADYPELTVHEITNAELLTSLEEAEAKYFADDYGFLYDDDFTETISAVFLIFVFAVIPFAIFVVFLVMAICSKAVYRKMFRLICILSGAELIIFGILTAFIMMYK